MDKPIVIALGPVDREIVEPILGAHAALITAPTPDDIAVAVGAIARADAVVDAAFLDRAKRLRVIARTGVGVDRVDVEAATARNIPVVITPGSGTRAVAEGVIAMTLHLVKRLGPLTALVREGRWAQRGELTLGDLDGATMGIVGYGRIGRRVGELASAFGMRVLAHDPYSSPPEPVNCPGLDNLTGASDVITLHVPLTEQTHHLVDKQFLDRVQPGTILVNCGRGGLLDLDAALQALQSGRLGGVGLDVFDPEPAVHHRLFDRPDVVLSPHLTGMTRRAQALTFADAAHGVLAVITGRQPAAVANPTTTVHS